MVSTSPEKGKRKCGLQRKVVQRILYVPCGDFTMGAAEMCINVDGSGKILTVPVVLEIPHNPNTMSPASAVLMQGICSV